MVWLILAIILLLLIVFIVRSKKKEYRIDYFAIFVLGIIWVIIGFWRNYSLVMGAILIIIGLANMKKWQKVKRWKKLSKNEKILRVVILIMLAGLLIGGIAYMVCSHPACKISVY